MGSITDYAEDALLDHVFNGAYSPVATVYLALATADPTDAATGGSFNECADSNAYARTAITFSAAASRVITQTGPVTFPQASGGGWGTVSHWAIVDNSSHGAGNVLAHGAFDASKTVNDGNTPEVPTTEINVTFSAGEISDALTVKLLDLMFRNQAYAAPDTYVAFVLEAVADADTGSTISEPTGGSYAREQVEPNGGSSPTWNTATGTTPTLVDNLHAITFTQATGDWGTCTGVAICSAVSGGDLLFYDNTMSDQAVNNGDTASFPIGDLDITMS
jgi:hypothetical protein